MTDKTDISELRRFNFEIWPHEAYISEQYDGEYVLFADANQQLEAERHTNSRLEEELAALKGDQVPVAWIRERAIDKPEHKGKVWRDISYPVKPEPAAVDGVYHDVIIPLYDRPQKPVVLPSLTIGEVMHRSGYDRQYAEGWVSANDNAIREIKAAGGIVKDGE